MKETLEEFYNHLVGIKSPWVVECIERDSKNREVKVIVRYNPDQPVVCPECGKLARIDDHRSVNGDISIRAVTRQ